MRLESERLLLRPLRVTDAWDIYINIKDKEVSRYNIVPPARFLNNPIGRLVRRIWQLTVKSIKVVCAKLHFSFAMKDMKLGVVFKETKKVIGIAGAENIDRVNR